MRYILLFTVLIFSACSSQPEKAQVSAYADLKGFFESEAMRLQNANPEIIKSVARNNASETKIQKGIDWKTELSLFTESDINKPAWKDSYKVISRPGNTTYLSADSNLRTIEINLSRDVNGKIRKVNILNRSQNILYSTTERLVYIPDSVYQISKQQHVVFLGDNHYQIKGLF